MTARLFSMGLFGLETYTVEVEADISRGLPAFDIVGLPDTAVRESRERVRAAMKNCGFDFPVSRITMNLAPADKKKEGPMYDLPLLAALLAATGQLTLLWTTAFLWESCPFPGKSGRFGACCPWPSLPGKPGSGGCLSRRKTPGKGRLPKGWRSTR